MLPLKRSQDFDLAEALVDPRKMVKEGVACFNRKRVERPSLGAWMW